MSKTTRLIEQLQEISALDEALRYQLKAAENTLNNLLNKREKAVRLANSQKWDISQYLLDDLQQNLSDISESLADFEPIPRPLDQFLAA